jgi:hypothetical protein
MEHIPHSGQVEKISLMIVGAQKAGTTSLKNYLGQHPALKTHPHKEFAYFVDPDQYQKKFANASKKYFHHNSNNFKLIAKNAGLFANEPGIIRLKEHNPDCKLVLILRNPVERTYSSFLMEKNYGAIDGSFDLMESVLKQKDPTDWRYKFLIEMGLYHIHIKMIFRHFRHEQVMVIRYRDFEAAPAKICSDIFKWLEVDPGFIPDTTKRYNQTTVTRSPRYGKFILNILRNQNPVKKVVRQFMPGKMDYKVGELLRNVNKRSKTHEPISEKMTNLLVDFFTPHNNELSNLTGIDFSDWNEKK